ncbi:hypothetical protein HU200_048667 [Digitaria exilis]|uniref:Uncharacterized protein n=1 Tax=Digitaria exilis TaxID=1010633 RepID=A0A835EBI8_9POAL|nr:hypothetical protein HU200_048667 [Digitaria exilis]
MIPNYLNSQKEVLCYPLLKTALSELPSNLLNLSALILCAGISVKLPYLPAEEVVRRPQPWPTTLANLQPPHEPAGR